MKPCRLTIFILGAFLTFAAKSQVFDVAYKNDAPTRTFLIPAKSAKAVVLLFPGGGGMLKLDDDGQTKNPHTFVRAKDLWVQYGIDAVLVDTPYDLGLTKKSRRGTDDHLGRVKAVAEFYKNKLNLPIWIFGHSMGSATITNFANQNKAQKQIISGLIVAGTNNTATLDEDVLFPVMAIHHKQDSCPFDPVRNSEIMISSRPKGSSAKLVLLDGGVAEGDECQSLSYHGFNKIEDQLVRAAAQFILAN